MSDAIVIKGLRAQARIGAFDDERRNPQTLVLDVALESDLSGPGHSDDLSATIDYGFVTRRLVEFVESTEVKLLERMATLVAELLLEELPVDRVTVEIGKQDPPVDEEVDSVSVRIVRSR